MITEHKDLAERINQKLRTVTDFPESGVEFYDFTPVLLDKNIFHDIVDALSELPVECEYIAGIDARGFLLASAVAYKRNAGVLVVRKQGKLPPPVIAEEYTLEYSSDTLEIVADLPIQPGERVLIIDDVLATGGSAHTTINIVEQTGAQVVGLGVVIEIAHLQGRNKCTVPVWTLCTR